MKEPLRYTLLPWKASRWHRVMLEDGCLFHDFGRSGGTQHAYTAMIIERLQCRGGFGIPRLTERTRGSIVKGTEQPCKYDLTFRNCIDVNMVVQVDGCKRDAHDPRSLWMLNTNSATLKRHDHNTMVETTKILPYLCGNADAEIVPVNPVKAANMKGCHSCF